MHQTMISRKSRRLKRDSKPAYKRLENASLSRLASTPIGNGKVAHMESTPGGTPEQGIDLPEFNLSRVEVQNINFQSPTSPYVAVDFQSRTQQLKESLRKEYSRDGSGALTDALLSTSLNSTTYDNFVGFRDRMQKVIDRKRRFSSMFPVRVSLSERFREISRETKRCKQMKIDRAVDDTNSCHSISSPDFNACPTPPFQPLNPCVTPPVFQERPCETTPSKRHVNSCHIVTRSQSSTFQSTKTCFPLLNNNTINNTSPSNSRVAASERLSNWLSPRVRRSPRVPEASVFRSPVVAPTTPNTRSDSIEKHYEIEFQVPMDGLSESRRASPIDDSHTSFQDTRAVSLLSPPPKSLASDGSGASDNSSSKSVSHCMSQLSVSCPSDVQPTSDTSIKASKKPTSTRNRTGARRSVNMNALEWPFTALEDNELRYIQACSSTVLAASAAQENSIFDSKRKSSNDSISMEKRGFALQPNGDNRVEAKDDFLKDLRKQNICNFPTYRFNFEFLRPTRLEDSRFGLIFAARNRIDGRMYCIKKSRGNGDQLTDRHGNLVDERSGPSYAEARKELQQEAIALANIPFHENIVRYFSAWIEYDCIYVQLEYCNGGSLLDYLEQYAEGSALSKFRLLHLMGDIGSAVQHLHENGMVHLDLTPGNILIHLPSLYQINGIMDIQDQLEDRRASIDRIMKDPADRLLFKLSDFGRCRTQSQSSILEEVGDPEFMPFEVFGSIDGRISDDIDIFKIDVFSFGLTVYRAMGGKHIEKPETDEEKINFHKQLTSPPNADKLLFKFVQKMVRMPSLRPSMEEVLNFPGVCEASWSRHCVVKRVQQLHRTVPSNRNLRQHK